MSLARDRHGWVATLLALASLVACGRSRQGAPDAAALARDARADRGDAGGFTAGAPDAGDADDVRASSSLEAGDASDGGAADEVPVDDANDGGAADATALDVANVEAAGPPDPGDAGEGGAVTGSDAGDVNDDAVDATADAGASGTTGGTGGAGGAGGAAGSAGATEPPVDAGGTRDAGGSCVAALHGHYVVRTDHEAMLEVDDATKTQRPVLDGATGMPLQDVAAIHEGYAHACAVLGSAKTAWCWRTTAGGNAIGQLGSGATDTNGAVFSASRVLAAANQPLTNVKAIAQSYTAYYYTNHQVNQSCAVTGDGHLYCWGDLTYLTGDSSPASSAYAVPITTNGSTLLAGVLAVSLSTDFQCALLQGAQAREVWCWGANGSPEVLGQGDENARRYPAKVLGLTNPTKVVSADSTVCALDGGQVRCWGYNGHGEAGVGNLDTPVHSPKAVVLMGGAAPLANVSDLSAGNNLNGGTTSFCALDATARKLFCWGTAYHEYASAYAVPEIVAVGAVDQDSTNGQSLVRALTSDGLYRVGAVTRQPNCGPLK